MLDAWSRAYAERWGLPQAALSELHRILDAVHTGEVVDDQVQTLLQEQRGALSTPPSRPGRSAPDRYDDMELIKEGGMGEVRRVWDRSLNRTVAMKVLRGDLADRDDLKLRFIEEAQATGQLEHPGIVPIYDIGTLADGRPYFTMKEIRGRTLLDVIEELHVASVDGWRATSSAWTFQKVIGVFRSVCEAVAYAHARGVLHRDIKPTNIMVGAFGEVVVMDWGLAKITGSDTVDAPHPPIQRQVITTRSRENLYLSQSGSVAGTPNYMPPEQARADIQQIGPWSDVYALGALLYEILADRAPYQGENFDEVVQQVLAGPPPAPYPRFHRPGQASPDNGLREICRRAMARDLAHRYLDARSLADDVQAWLDTASARDRAVSLVERSDQLRPEILDLRKRSATLRARASSALADLPRTATPTDKRAAWALEDRADALESRLLATQSRRRELLKAALAGVPDLPEAQSRLKHLDASPHRPPEGPPQPQGLNTQVDPDTGWITVLTEPAGARVQLRRLQRVHRRIIALPVPHLPDDLQTPLIQLAIPVGSYQIRLTAPGHVPLTVLARVEAGEVWSTVPAGTTTPRPLALHNPGEDPPNTVRIPHGWSWFGGDMEGADSLPRTRAWLDGYCIRRHPVTNGEYLAFLRHLEQSGSRDQVAGFAPPAWIADAWLVIPPHAAHDAPVRQISFDAATAFAAWTSARTGRIWRLPREREWERAARGVDERLYPWGNFLDPSWSCVADSHDAPPLGPAPVHAFATDVSPHGVRGLGGNVRDWCIGDAASSSGPILPQDRRVRGGYYLGIGQFARSALSYRPSTDTHVGVGFRLVTPIPRDEG